jgi:DNA-binding SARP family transcriptional activator
VDFRILGPLEVVDDGREVMPSRPKQRALLARLLLRPNRVVSTDELVEALWGDGPPETARTALHGHIAALRKRLGPETIETKPTGYVLSIRPEQIDLGRFQALVDEARGEDEPVRRSSLLRAALGLFRGEPLADFRYEEFARAERDRIEDLRLGTIEQWVDAELEQGSHADLVPELERLAAQHPLRERLRAQLMLALYRSGRQSEALHAYQDARQMLAEELGLDPGPELQELERKILAHNDSLALPSRTDTQHTRPARRERKLVTVLLCDLIDVADSGDGDPEDVQSAVEPSLALVRTRLEHFGGTFHRFIGDTVIALFGAPVAHEDDPERAVRAALAIRDAFGDQLELRLAVHTGKALVTLEADPDAVEAPVAGDVVNTASRLQSAGPPNGISVGELTYRLTEHAIEYRPLEPVAARAKGEPVLVWEALSPRAIAEQRRPRAELVGRRRELDQLVHALACARADSSPRLATVLGVPGMGKTRLIGELYARIAAEPDDVMWLQGRSLPYGEGITFWALGEIVKARAGIFEADPAELAEAKLVLAVEETLGTGGEATWVLRHLRPLVGLASDATPGSDTRAESFAAWHQFLEALAEKNPLVLAFEDLHWADEVLLDFVDVLVDRAADVPLFVVCTSRPELLERRPGWGGGQRNSMTIWLAPLSDDETVALLRGLLGAPEPSRQLVARAEGNPLYAEEYARLVRDLGSQDELSVPESLHSVIAGRLDILPPDEKALVQDAAVVGETAWAGAIAAVGGRLRAAVDELARPLERKEYLRRRRRTSIEGEMEYAFPHVLVRDVAYEQIPRAERAAKHELAAEWIESLGRREDHAELLTHHYLRALDLARAAGNDTDRLEVRARRAAVDAGDRAASLGAYEVAARHFELALELWPENDPERPQLLLRHAKAVFLGGSDEEVGAAVERARVALTKGDDVEGAAQADLLLGELAYDQGDGPRALHHFRRAASLVEERPTSRAKAMTFIVNAVYLALFDKEGAPRYAEEGLAMAEELDSLDLRAAALDRLGVVMMAEGNADEGQRRLEQSVALTEGLISPTAIRATGNLASLLGDIGQLAASRTLHERCLALASRLGARRDVRWATAERVEDLYLTGEWDEAWQAADNYLAEAEAAPYWMDVQCFAVRARMRYASGERELALADTERSLDIGRDYEGGQVLLPALALRCRHVAASDPREAAMLLNTVLGQIAGKRWIWNPSFLIDVAYALHHLDRGDELAPATAATLATPWLVAARTIAAREFVRAAETLAGIGSRPDEADARLHAAEQLIAQGRHAEADEQLERALEFWRAVGASAYVREGETLLAASS